MQANLFGVIEPTTIFSQQQASNEGKGSNVMDQQDFLNLLVEQLKNQDPLNPVENQDFMTQTTMFSQLDENIKMNEALQSLLELSQLQANNMNTLINGTNFIGKEIEFTTNTITLGGDQPANFKFYLGENPDLASSQVNVYNTEGELVATYKPTELKEGENIINWNGVGVGGVTVGEGTYRYEVLAFNSEGEQLQVDEFSTGIVQSVSQVGDILYFDVGDGVVSSEYVYTVREPKEEANPDADAEADADTDSTVEPETDEG